jgi:hypothetical protein
MSKTLKNRGGGLFDWLGTQLGLDRSYATQRASSKTRRQRRKKIENLYDFSRSRRSNARSSRSGSGTRKSKSK